MGEDSEGARASIKFGLTLLSGGAVGEAAQEFKSAISADPSNADGYYYLAQTLSMAGQDDAAASVFRLALENVPDEFLNSQLFNRYQGAGFDAPTTRNFYNALAERQSYLREYLAPSPLVGSYGLELSVEQETAIGELLDTRWRDWQNGDTPLPSKAEQLKNSAQGNADTSLRVMSLFQSHVSGNPEYTECIYPIHIRTSLSEAGFVNAFHDGDHLCFDTDNPETEWGGRQPFAQALADLRQQIAEFRPDIFVLDGNYMGSAETLDRDDMAALKSEFGFKLVVMVADAYPPLDNYPEYWLPVADMTVGGANQSYMEELTEMPPKLLSVCLATADGLFHPQPAEAKDIGLFMSGSRRRDRDFWSAHALSGGVNSFIRLTDRRASQALGADEFYEIMGRSRLVLNNGILHSNAAYVPFRLFEAIGSGALTIQQEVGPAAEYFAPYVHYLPFSNTHEMVCFSQYMLKHEHVRARMVEASASWRKSHFSGSIFWGAVMNGLKVD